MSESTGVYKIDGRPATIFRTVKSKDNPYVMIDRRPVDNPKLSFKAKGILTYLLSRPDGWEVNLVDLANRSTDGLASVKAGVQELQKAGHLRHLAMRNPAGQIISHLWEVYEIPQIENQLMDTPTGGGMPEVENPQGGLTTSGESHAINNKYLNNNEINNIGEPQEKNKKTLKSETPSLFWNGRDLSQVWETVSEHVRPGIPRQSQSRLDSCVPVAWDAETHTLTVQAADPEWLNDRLAKSASNLMVGVLNVADPHVVFVPQGDRSSKEVVCAP
jgi:hypothetical protein